MLTNDLLQDINTKLAPASITNVRLIQTSVVRVDSTEKYQIQTTGGDFALIISSPISPLMVKRATDRQREAKQRLHGCAAEPIELPVNEGFFAERSYALWIYGQPWSSGIWSRIERMLLAPRVYRWLRDVASQTVAPADLSQLLANLHRLLEFGALPKLVRIAAEKAYRVLGSEEVLPIQIMEHGDLTCGNILKTRRGAGFLIIDWAGATMSGAPFGDLVKFAFSTGSSNATLRREIAAHSRLLGCDPRHVALYVLSGLGELSSHLGYFPESDFLYMCEQTLRKLQAATS